jgi:hypothetical protein
MNIQVIIIAIVFVGALFYVCRLMYRNIFAKKSCGSNCKCGIDFSAVEPDKVKK